MEVPIEVEIDDLILDINNPRFGFIKIETEKGIIEHLLEHEKLKDLCKDILQTGYNQTKTPLAIKEGDKYRVYDGNRRVAALKLLKNPKQYNINLEAKDIGKIYIWVYPEEETHTLIQAILKIHTDGDGIRKWSQAKQGKFIYEKGKFIYEKGLDNKIEENKNKVKYYFLSRYVKEHIDESKGVIMEDTPLTPWDMYLLRDKVGKNLFDFNKEDGTIQPKNKERFDYIVKRLYDEIVVKKTLTSRTHTSDKQEAYIEEIIEEFKKSRNNTKNETSESYTEKKQTSVDNKQSDNNSNVQSNDNKESNNDSNVQSNDKKPTKYIPPKKPDIKLSIQNTKIQYLIDEINDHPYKTKPNSILALTRILLECVGKEALDIKDDMTLAGVEKELKQNYSHKKEVKDIIEIEVPYFRTLANKIIHKPTWKATDDEAREHLGRIIPLLQFLSEEINSKKGSSK